MATQAIPPLIPQSFHRPHHSNLHGLDRTWSVLALAFRREDSKDVHSDVETLQIPEPDHHEDHNENCQSPAKPDLEVRQVHFHQASSELLGRALLHAEPDLEDDPGHFHQANSDLLHKAPCHAEPDLEDDHGHFHQASSDLLHKVPSKR